MNILKNSVNTLDEIIFENRNKTYGAYAIRASYDNTVFKSLAIMGGTFLLLGISTLVLNHKVAAAKIPVLDFTNDPPPTYSVIVNVTPPSITPKTAQKQSSSAAAKATNENYIIKDNPIIETNHPVDPIESPIANPSDKPGLVDNPTTNNPGGNPGPETSNPSSSTGDIVMGPDVLPSFVNLSSFLQRNLQYPMAAKEANVSGKVVVNFVIDEEGKIIVARIISGIGYGCDEEALRVIKLMPKWKPGMMGGKAVKVSFNQIFAFKLQ